MAKLGNKFTFQVVVPGSNKVKGAGSETTLSAEYWAKVAAIPNVVFVAVRGRTNPPRGKKTTDVDYEATRKDKYKKMAGRPIDVLLGLSRVYDSGRFTKFSKEPSTSANSITGFSTRYAGSDLAAVVNAPDVQAALPVARNLVVEAWNDTQRSGDNPPFSADPIFVLDSATAAQHPNLLKHLKDQQSAKTATSASRGERRSAFQLEDIPAIMKMVRESRSLKEPVDLHVTTAKANKDAPSVARYTIGGAIVPERKGRRCRRTTSAAPGASLAKLAENLYIITSTSRAPEKERRYLVVKAPRPGSDKSYDVNVGKGVPTTSMREGSRLFTPRLAGSTFTMKVEKAADASAAAYLEALKKLTSGKADKDVRDNVAHKEKVAKESTTDAKKKTKRENAYNVARQAAALLPSLNDADIDAAVDMIRRGAFTQLSKRAAPAAAPSLAGPSFGAAPPASSSPAAIAPSIAPASSSPAPVAPAVGSTLFGSNAAPVPVQPSGLFSTQPVVGGGGVPFSPASSQPPTGAGASGMSNLFGGNPQ